MVSNRVARATTRCAFNMIANPAHTRDLRAVACLDYPH